MSIAENAARCLGGRPQGEEWIARCPAHDDKTPSLSLKDGYSGKLVWNFKAGCTQEEVQSALLSLDIKISDKSEDAKQFRPRLKSEAEEDTTYEGYDRACALVRRAGKQSKTDRKIIGKYLRNRGITVSVPKNLRLFPRGEFTSYGDGSSEFHSLVAPITDPVKSGRRLAAHITWIDPKTMRRRKPKNKARLTYGRGELGARGGVIKFFRRSDGPILIGESIEEALSVHQLTGSRYECWSALSAGNMPRVAVPAGREVIICANNDDTGRSEAKKQADRLAQEGKKIALVLPPEEGMDWNAALQNPKLDKDTLADLILDAEPIEPPIPPGPVIVPFGEASKIEIVEQESLLAPWLPPGVMGMVYGQAGLGKTFFLLGISYAVSRGAKFLRWSCENPGGVLYIDGEMPFSQMQPRINGFERYYKDEDQLASLDLWALSLQKESDMPDLSTPEGQRLVDEQVKPGTRLIIVDPLVDLVRSGNENEAESWRPVAEWAKRHCARGRTVLFAHHAGKAGTQRGTSRREGNMHAIIKLQRPEDYVASKGAVFEISFDKARGIPNEGLDPFLARLKLDATGQMMWETEALSKQKRDVAAEVIERLNAGERQKDIAEALAITPGYVSQIKHDARQKGLLNEKEEKDGAADSLVG